MPVFALVDCNNFYVSCERMFQPSLEGKPVVVLSNNDGCAVSRSAEVKALGIKMAAPIQDFIDLVRPHKIHVFSSNYALYHDISRRVVEVLNMFTPRLEVYSVDESFLSLDGFGDLIAYARKIRATVRQWTRIPTCVGIASTKTLAKLANAIAKKHPGMGGVCSLLDPIERMRWLKTIPVGDVWGIGSASADKLTAIGIYNVAQLLQADAKAVRGLLTVVGERILRELHGQSCVALEDIPAQRKGTAATRSFGRDVDSWDDVSQALTTHASRVGEKLREMNLVTAHLTVFMETNRFKPELPQYNPSRTILLPEETNDTRDLVAAAQQIGKAIFKTGFIYKKSGVITAHLTTPGRTQRSLFGRSDVERAKRASVMKVMDAINTQHGRNRLRLGSSGFEQDWQMRRERMSKLFTVRWDELPVVRA